MSEYLFLYRGGRRATTPEGMAEQGRKWAVWLEELGERGFVQDRGRAVGLTGSVVTSPGVSTTTGEPYGDEQIVVGYSVVRTSGLDEANELAASCPIFDTGGVVEVRPIVSMG